MKNGRKNAVPSWTRALLAAAGIGVVIAGAGILTLNRLGRLNGNVTGSGVPTTAQPYTDYVPDTTAPDTSPAQTGTSGPEGYMWFDDVRLVGRETREHGDAERLRETNENLNRSHFSGVSGLTGIHGFDYTGDPEGMNAEGVEKLFDEDETTKNCCGKDKVEERYIIWEMDRPVTVRAYVMTTGNDSADYPGRNPVAWALLGCDDEEYIGACIDAGMTEENLPVWQLDPENEEDWTKWKVIDIVYDGGLPNENCTQVAFEVDPVNQAPSRYYMWYCLYVDPEGGTVYQLSGISLLGTADTAEETQLTAEE